MNEFFSQTGFMPHGMCFMWKPEILWPTVISDISIALAYYVFMAAMIVFVHKRKDLKYKWFFILAGSLVFFTCGTSHLVAAVVIWNPIYQIAAFIKIITALSSIAASVLIWKVIPVFLRIPSPSDLEKKNSELENIISKLQVANADVIEAEKLAALGNIVAGVAHELNTPIGICITANSIAQYKINSNNCDCNKDSNDFKDIVEANNLVTSNLIRSRELINTFKEISASDFPNVNRLVDLKELLTSITDTTKPKLRGGNHILIINCPEDIVIKSHPSPLIRIITNLVSNSIKHGFTNNDCGQIEIQIKRKTNTELSIDYTDDGNGMTDGQISRIFEPFYKIKRTTGGPGLGMTIVYNTISKLGGNIQCNSRPDGGIHFSIVLPVEYVLEETYIASRMYGN